MPPIAQPPGPEAGVEPLVVPFDHLLALSDDVGVLEHALQTTPRREHGYCLDDNARALIVCTRTADPPPGIRDLAARCLAFVSHSLDPDGRCHNRLSYARRFEDDAGTGDWWGRALWALGLTAASGAEESERAAATDLFRSAARQRSPWPRAMAYAALGAAHLLEVEPLISGARALLADATTLLLGPPAGAGGPWPEHRLTYANAVWPEALLAAGSALNDPAAVDRALELLAWLVDVETRDGRLSVTPVRGWAPGEPRPGFDQQPIEVAALAEACARAYRVTGDARWARVVSLAAAWFTGHNDTGVEMMDPRTGGGFDGLQPRCRNANQGAESTLALHMTFQSLALVTARAPARAGAGVSGGAAPVSRRGRLRGTGDPAGR